MKKILIHVICITILINCLSSCNKSNLENKEGSSVRNPDTGVAEKYELMTAFSKILASAVAGDPSLRSFIRQEAVKMFDLDYDLLYQLVKDKMVAENETFRQKLTKYVADPRELMEIENKLPLLTIFIPELPSGFSAATWNDKTEIPAVSPGLIQDNKVTYYRGGNIHESVEAEKIPGFPLLVIKENDRVVLQQPGQKNARNITTLSSNQFNYQFIDESFNGLSPNTAANRAFTNDIDPDALYAYRNNIDWQRDYVYYGLTPGNPNGKFKPQYQEHITAITFNDVNGYWKIRDHADDPRPVTDERFTGWVEGFFEFEVIVLINSTNGLGTAIKKNFPVPGSQLFNLTYDYIGGYYYLRSIGPPKTALLNIPVASWDLQTTGVAWKYVVSEIDPSQTITWSTEHISQVATNFGFDIGFGEVIKIGLKFGITDTETSRSTYTVATQVGNDVLGEAGVYFYDKIVTSYNPAPPPFWGGTTHEVNTGWLKLSVEPRRVY